MDAKYYGRIVGKNIKRLAYEHGKTQTDISRDLNISKSTVSSWMNGTRVPKMNKVDILCEYFGCKRSDIMEEKTDNVIIPEVILDVLKSSDRDHLLEYARFLNQKMK